MLKSFWWNKEWALWAWGGLVATNRIVVVTSTNDSSHQHSGMVGFMTCCKMQVIM